MLIASHIKPWRDSTNAERINGFNGFMLSPHIDAMFDERLISFEDDGHMLVHPSLSNEVLARWSISRATKVEKFGPEQVVFLGHHRHAFKDKAA